MTNQSNWERTPPGIKGDLEVGRSWKMLATLVATRPSMRRVVFSRALCQANVIRLRNSATLLGVKLGATPKEVKTAYYKLARTTHPDIVGAEANVKEANKGPGMDARDFNMGVLDDPAGPPSVVRFLEVQAAYECLCAAVPPTLAPCAPRCKSAAGGLWEAHVLNG